MPRSLAFPVRLNASGALATNAQDSDDDVANGLLFALAWPQGTRTLDPSYGRPAEADGGEPDADAMAAAAARSEPRARTRGDLLAFAAGRAVEQVGYES
jgi:hypothetical protein